MQKTQVGAASPAAACVPLSRKFTSRLVIALVLTALDAWTAISIGPTAIQSSRLDFVLAVTFAVLGLGLITSLVRVWCLTFRSRK